MPTEKDIRKELQRVVESGRFAASARLPQFLRHVVEVALAGQNERLKGPILANEVFQRGKDFDPRLDPIVRVEARRLRTRLEEYYSGEGANHAIRIEIPRGTYVPVFLEMKPAPNRASRSPGRGAGEEPTQSSRPGENEAVPSLGVSGHAEGAVTVRHSNDWLYFTVLSLFAIGSVWLWTRKK